MKRLRALWVELTESFFMAMNAVTAHKLRSALTLLGVLVGVFSIILVMTAMRAMKARIESDLNQLGGQTFFITRWPALPFERSSDPQKYRRRKRISLEHGLAVERHATLAINVGMEEADINPGTMISRYTKTAPNMEVYGETPGSFPCQNWTIHEGRGLTESDLDGLRDVCILGSDVATNLFPYGSAIGQRISFNNVNYNVVGVMDPRGAANGGQEDNFAIIPITTALNRYVQKQWVDLTIMIQARSPEAYNDTVDQVRSALRLARKVPPGQDDDFEITSADSLMSQLESFTKKLRIGITLVSSIALLAAGIGIMNIMLVSVTERTREIGIRRAIGARKRSIMTQFVMEAIVLCELGGVIGVALGVAGGDLLAHLMKLPNVLPVDWIFIGLGICSLVGMIFGTYPAWKAANLDPIESLRYE